VPSSQRPKVLNPKSGIVISSNNRLTSDQVKHGIGHTFNFEHRYLRIREMIDGQIEKGERINSELTKLVQLDVLDVQVRESLRFMVYLVENWKE